MNIGPYTFEEFKTRAMEFHGYPAPGLLIGGYMVEKAKSLMPEGVLFEVIVESAKCLPDAVQLLTVCTFGNARIRLANTGRYALALYEKFSGQGWRVYLDREKLRAFPEIEAWLMKTKAKKEQDSARLFAEIEAAGDAICGQAPIVIHERFLGKPPSSGIEPCPLCQEPYPVNDGPVCRGCLGEVPYVHARRPMVNTECDLLCAVPVEEAVGKTALHDMTRIVPGQEKGPAFKAGQVLGAGDVCRLQRMGRGRVYVHENNAELGELVHENAAVTAFAERIAGEGVRYPDTPREGKLDFSADRDGLLVVDRKRLLAFNMVPNVMCATRQSEIFVEKGRPVAGARAIPLYLTRENHAQAMSVLGDGPLVSVIPLKKMAVGVLVTGTEVFQGLIQDKFIPVIVAKAEHFGCPVIAEDIAPDNREAISAAIRKMLDAGVELLVTTAGLSVDPDDVTRQGLADAGLENELHGAPILPGAMTLLGNIGATKVIGVPACALFHKTTSFDLLLPRILAGREITRRDLADMAEGSLCLNCNICTFPKCPFGK